MIFYRRLVAISFAIAPNVFKNVTFASMSYRYRVELDMTVQTKFFFRNLFACGMTRSVWVCEKERENERTREIERKGAKRKRGSLCLSNGSLILFFSCASKMREIITFIYKRCEISKKPHK